MTVFLLTGVVLFSSFFLCAYLLDRLVVLSCLRLWQLEPQAPLRHSTSELYYIFSAILVAALFGLLWRSGPLPALGAALGVQLLLVLLAALRIVYLTSLQLGYCREQLACQEFRLSEGAILSVPDRQPLPPAVCRIEVRSQRPPGPFGWSFELYSLALYHPEQGRLAGNSFYAASQARSLLTELVAQGGCRELDLTFFWRQSAQSFYSVTLDGDWVPLLCSDLQRLPPMVRNWWKAWLSLEFPGAEPQTVDGDEFDRYLKALQLVVEEGGEPQGGVALGCQGLAQLLEISGGELQVVETAQLRRQIPARLYPRSESAGDFSPVSPLQHWCEPSLGG